MHWSAKAFHCAAWPGGIGAEDREAADLLVAAGLVDLVELVPPAEFGADRIP